MWEERSVAARTRGLRFVEPKKAEPAPPGSFWERMQIWIRTGEVMIPGPLMVREERRDD